MNPTNPISGEMLLAELQLPQLPMVIEQAFSVLVWQSGAIHLDIGKMSVAELALEAKQPLPQVIARLERLRTLSADIEMDAESLHRGLEQARTDLFLLDVREPWEFAIGALPNSTLLAEFELRTHFESLRDRHVITLCHHGIRSLSAAYYLREAGLPRVSSLRGGLDAWALRIDPNFPRY